jgi:hypothetical protein
MRTESGQRGQQGPREDLLRLKTPTVMARHAILSFALGAMLFALRASAMLVIGGDG